MQFKQVKGIKPQGKPWNNRLRRLFRPEGRGFKPFAVVAKMLLQASIFARLIK